MKISISKDTYVKQVQSGASFGSEYIKAGNEGDIFIPHGLIWIEFNSIQLEL